MRHGYGFTSALVRFAGLIACQGLLVFFAAPPPLHAQTTRTPTPVISPGTGIYSGTQTVTITDANSAATLYYTTDGTTPTTSSPKYAGAFQVSTTSTVQAIAVASGSPNSLSASAIYTFNDVTVSLGASNGAPYSLYCGVSGLAQFSPSGPTGDVTFTDTAIAQTLGTATLPTRLAYPFLQYLDTNLLSPSSVVRRMTTGDFNGDGKIDVITGDITGLSLWLGNGDGTFQPSIPVDSGSFAVDGIASGDFNGDGKMDIAIAQSNADYSAEVAVYLGNGDGTFQAPVKYVAGSDYGLQNSPGGIIAADFGNGKVDLAVTDPLSNVVWVLLGNGDGTFQTAVSYVTGQGPWGLVAGNFTGHGHLDLAIYNEGDNSLSVLPGNGDGTFATQIVTTGLYEDFGPAAADFNNDGHLDLAMTGVQTAILLGNGDGTFQYTPSLDFARGGYSIAAGDIDGDGNADLVMAEGQVLKVELGKGDGTFPREVGQQLGTESGSTSVVIGKFAGGSTPEIAAGSLYSPFKVFAYSSQFSPLAVLSNVAIDGSTANHTIQCSYPGDSHYQGGISNVVNVTLTQLPLPVFSLLAGVYNTPQTVTITDANDSATFYYTTDGSTPTVNSTKYTAPIPISTTTTLKAIAVLSGFENSPVSEAVYTFASTPSFTPPPGNYSSAQQVTISDTTPSANIYYTTDGTTPTVKSNRYGSPVALSGKVVLQAMAVAPGFLNSVVATGNYLAGKMTPTIVLTTSAATTGSNTAVTFTATVSSSVSTPTGSVAFMDGSTQLGTGQLSAGVATLTTSSLASGSHSITAVYSGDSDFVAVTSSALTETIGQITISVPGGSTSITVAPGGSGTYTLSFAPPNGGVFANAVTFSIAGLPSGATATFSPSSIAAGAGATTVTLSITVPASAALAPDADPFGRNALPLALGLILLPFLGIRRKAGARWWGVVLLVALGCGMGMASGCGGGAGGSGSSGGGGGGNSQPQTYNLTVTATSGNVSSTQTLTLTVQ